MWNWACHVRHNWKSKLTRAKIKKVKTLWQKQLERKGIVPKSYDKICHNKSMKQLNKECMISFWRLKIFFRTKAGNFWKKRVQFHFGDSVSKAGKSIKLSGIKASTIWLMNAHFLSHMDDLDMETSPHGPYISIFSRRTHDWARVMVLCVNLISLVNYCLYLLRRSPRDILKKDSSSI